MYSKVKIVKALPWWVLASKPPGSTIPPFTWDPSQIASAPFVFYLEGDTLSTSGSSVTTATDKGGGGRNFTGHNVTWTNDATVGSKPVLVFNGTTAYLDRSATQIHPNYGAACTHIIAFKPNNLPGSGDFRILGGFNTNLSGGFQGYFDYISKNSPAAGQQWPMSSGYAENDNTGVDTTLTTTWQLWVVKFTGGGAVDTTKFKYWLNGVLQTSNHKTAGTGNCTVNEIGRYPGGGLLFNGNIAFYIVLSGAISDAEADLTWQYCQNHYGMS